MKGKYITTILKLAMLAGSRKQKQVEVKETKAEIGQHRLIWSKELSAVKQSLPGKIEEHEALMA